MRHEPRILRSPEPATGGAPSETPQAVGAKETVISLIIAFAMAFVFRGYVVEPYVIPTNSMAPTLLGAHVRWVDPASGYDWPTHHFFTSGPNGAGAGPPLPQQGGKVGNVNFGPLTAYDPMTRQPVTLTEGAPLRSGDRIFVLRYLWPIFTPKRWDVVVFKTPTPPENPSLVSTGATQAFIKRLVGLPNEEIAIFDGDIFSRPNDGAATPAGKTRWDLPDWKVATKDERAQRAVWQPVFDSRYAIATDFAGRPFQGPFLGKGAGWEIAGRASYRYSGAGPTTLEWDTTADNAINYDSFSIQSEGPRQLEQIRRRWTLTDAYAMDEVFPQPVDAQARERASFGQQYLYPVSDLRLGAGVQPSSDGMTFSAVIRSRGFEFRGRLSPKGDTYEAVIEMRPEAADPAQAAAWTTLASAPSPSKLTKGAVTNVQFWHADQHLQIWIEDRLVTEASYNWNLAERVLRTIGKEPIELMPKDPRSNYDPERRNWIVSGKLYSKPKPWFELSGPAELHRVAIDRDLFYQPVVGYTPFAAGAHPAEQFSKKLGPDQYFTCGDNSPMSSDARAWTSVDRWVEKSIDPSIGVVNQRLMVGKAFFVYFPAVRSRSVFGANLPMVDSGRMRWIW